MTLTQAITKACRMGRRNDGAETITGIEGTDWKVRITSVRIYGTGPHRDWKYLYDLVTPDSKLASGGFDRQDSFIFWAKRRIAPPAQGA